MRSCRPAAGGQRGGKVLARHQLSAGKLGVGLGQPLHGLRVSQDCQRLFQSVEILDRDEDGRRATVDGNRDAFVEVVDGLRAQTGEPWPAQRHGGSHGQKYDPKQLIRSHGVPV
jgi:hypothetical protein